MMHLNKKKLLSYAFVALALSACEEIDGVFRFEQSGEGKLTLEVVYANELSREVEQCRSNLSQVEWNDVYYESQSSWGKNKCKYSYEFNDLEEVELLHRNLNLELKRLTVEKDHFIYAAKDSTCENDFDGEVIKSARWSVKTFGRIISTNADIVVGNKLTWNVSGFDCYDLFVESEIADIIDDIPEESTEEEPVSGRGVVIENKNIINQDSASSETKKEGKPLDSISIWTTIGASIATIFATLIAYRESKKKK